MRDLHEIRPAKREFKTIATELEKPKGNIKGQLTFLFEMTDFNWTIFWNNGTVDILHLKDNMEITMNAINKLGNNGIFAIIKQIVIVVYK